MSDLIGVAVIGVGHWGGHYVRVLGAIPEGYPAVVCDTDVDRRAAISQAFPHVPVVADLETALAFEGVEAAIVSTPATTHAELGAACLAAGKHVLVEKPLATNSSDAAALTQQAADRELTLMVGHTFLFHPAVLKLRELVTRPGIGKIHYLYARRTNLGPIRTDVNAIWDLASHDVSIMNFLLDATPDWVSAVGARVLHGHKEDVGFVSLHYPTGIVGHIHVSWADPTKVREVVVVAANERIVFNDMDTQESVRVFQRGVSINRTAPTTGWSFGEFKLTVRDGDIVSPRIDPSEPLRNQTAHFLDSLRGRWRPATDGTMGCDVVRVLEAIDRSMARNGDPVTVADEAAGLVMEETPVAHSLG